MDANKTNLLTPPPPSFHNPFFRYASYGHKYIGICFLQDALGEAWKDALVRECLTLDIQVITAGFESGNQESIAKAVEILSLAKVRSRGEAEGVLFILSLDFEAEFADVLLRLRSLFSAITL